MISQSTYATTLRLRRRPLQNKCVHFSPIVSAKPHGQQHQHAQHSQKILDSRRFQITQHVDCIFGSICTFEQQLFRIRLPYLELQNNKSPFFDTESSYFQGQFSILPAFPMENPKL